MKLSNDSQLNRLKRQSGRKKNSLNTLQLYAKPGARMEDFKQTIKDQIKY